MISDVEVNNANDRDIIMTKVEVEEEEDLTCPVCSEAFDSEDNLMLHTALLHDQSQGPFTCPACEKSFRYVV